MIQALTDECEWELAVPCLRCSVCAVDEQQRRKAVGLRWTPQSLTEARQLEGEQTGGPFSRQLVIGLNVSPCWQLYCAGHHQTNHIQPGLWPLLILQHFCNSFVSLFLRTDFKTRSAQHSGSFGIRPRDFSASSTTQTAKLVAVANWC